MNAEIAIIFVYISHRATPFTAVWPDVSSQFTFQRENATVNLYEIIKTDTKLLFLCSKAR